MLRAARPGLLLWLALAATAAAAQVKEPLPPGAEGELLRADDRRTQAMVDVDVPALQELLGDELRYTHANGTVDGKYVFIAALESGRIDYVSARTRDPVVQVHGDAGVVMGTMVLQVRAAEGPLQKLRLLFTAVYAKRDGSWRLVAYQSTRAAEPD